jgi:beta-phosphoglucomutase-like phosphatase (HAD superfamily)
MQPTCIVAADALCVKGEECVVIEDSQIGVDAAIGAGMRCVVTYTTSSKVQKFGGAEKIVAELGDDPPVITVEDMLAGQLSGDDR